MDLPAPASKLQAWRAYFPGISVLLHCKQESLQWVPGLGRGGEETTSHWPIHLPFLPTPKVHQALGRQITEQNKPRWSLSLQVPRAGSRKAPVWDLGKVSAPASLWLLGHIVPRAHSSLTTFSAYAKGAPGRSEQSGQFLSLVVSRAGPLLASV